MGPNNGCGEGHSKNVSTRGLTLAALTSPLREVPEAVNTNSASESSETSSEHHYMRVSHVEQKEESDDGDNDVEGLVDKVEIRIPRIRNEIQGLRIKDELRLCRYGPSELPPQHKTPPADLLLRTLA